MIASKYQVYASPPSGTLTIIICLSNVDQQFLHALR